MSKTLKNILCGLVALLVMAGIIIGSIALAQNVDFRVKQPEEKVEKQPDNETNDEATSGGMIVMPSNGSNKGVSIAATPIPIELYNAYGISPVAETASILTATVTPADATYKELDWAVEFVNPDSAWATGKIVTEYVKVTPTSDGALTANLECLKAFGEQIKIVAKLRQHEYIFAECPCDYVKKVTSLSVTPAEGTAIDFTYEGETYNFTYTPAYSDFTIDCEYTISTSLTLKSEFVTGFSSYLDSYLSGINNTFLSFTAKVEGRGVFTKITDINTSAFDFLSKFMKITITKTNKLPPTTSETAEYSRSSSRDVVDSAFYGYLNTLKSASMPDLFKLTVSATTDNSNGNSKSLTRNYGLGNINVIIPASGLQFNKSGFVF